MLLANTTARPQVIRPLGGSRPWNSGSWADLLFGPSTPEVSHFTLILVQTDCLVSRPDTVQLGSFRERSVNSRSPKCHFSGVLVRANRWLSLVSV